MNFVGWMTALVLTLPLAAQPAAEIIPSPEPDWPQWRGPGRDARCKEKGLREKWPEEGPRQVWTASEIGFGYSAPIVCKDRLYITGDIGEELRLFAYDLEGKRIWETRNGKSWKRPYPGARACPAYAEGRLFHMNAHGRVACFDAETGEEHWAVETHERFEAKNITWAKSECLLVDGNRVIVTPGGDQAVMAALDVQTGATVWATPALKMGESKDARFQMLPTPAGKADGSSYASPVLFKFGGRRILANCSLRHFFGVDADTGELLWVRPFKTRYGVIATTPALAGDKILVTAPDTEERWCYRMRATDRGVELDRLWKTDLDTCHGGLISAEGSFFGTNYRKKRGWTRLDAETGKVRYALPDLTMGSMLLADGHLYGLTQDGEALLLKPTDDEFRIDGRFTFAPEHEKDVWAHPVIHQRRLYLRYHDRLVCYDIGGK